MRCTRSTSTRLTPMPTISTRARTSLHRDALGQVPGLVDVAASELGDVVREELEGDGHHNRGEQLMRARDEQHLIRQVADPVVSLGGDRDDLRSPSLDL